MLASLSSNSFKQYDVYLKKWYTYCYQNKLNFYEPTIPEVIGFLTKMFEDGAQYGTLNSCRSALTLIIGEHISQDVGIRRFFKGVFRLRPTLPRYSMTWDTSIVLKLLEGYYPNEDLTLEAISKKLITLLALITAHRLQTFTKIKIQNIMLSVDKATIKIPELIKTSRVGSTQPLLILPFFCEKPQICPGKTLQCYLDKTLAVRNNETSLFIGLKKPHTAVSTQTLSRWVKSTLHDSGVDVNTFTAHSTRHAATSAAHRLGVNIDTIKRTAGWSGSSNTFFKFYNRPLLEASSDDSFAQAIINNLN